MDVVRATRPPAAPAVAHGQTGQPGTGRVGPLILALGALTAFAPLGTDMYIPGFPEMSESLHASDSAVQLSMTTFFAGIVLGQLFVGPLSDKLGRRTPMFVGTVLFTVLSAVCALAPNIIILDAARFLQGLAASAPMVLTRAVLTDRFHGPDLPRYFSTLSMVLGVAPVVAPLLGSLVLALTGWRIVFVVLTAIGVLLSALVLAAVPESLPPERRHAGNLAGTFGAMGQLLRRRTFVGYLLTGGFVTGAMFTYISGSSFVYERVFGTSTALYSLVFASNAVAMMIGASVFGRLSRHHRLNTLLTVGVGIAALGALVQTGLLATIGATMAGTWVGLAITLFAIGMIFPATMSLGQSLGRESAGAAAALQGGGQFAFGAVAAPLVGVFGTHSAAPMGVIMLVAIACGALTLTTLARPWRGEGEMTADPLPPSPHEAP